MGVFNILHADIVCARCGWHGISEVEMFFGFRNLIEYRVGDVVTWTPGASAEEGGRPSDGNIDGEAYVECERCHKDFFVKVAVRGDVIRGVEPDLSRVGYIQT